ncbi:conserved hypothetical protein [Flavobacterium sp. 9R]|uniref:hypothetical protein n=1 Tax=Flavobacterium sp. 9R TaxID=2653143 RepID=UPI0012F0935E|nr:hypothetical protein [Flavobacterium sp. 9R]VXC07592.1 conserved hypothetical protein [Flavobacterium sp. 9R]
MAVPNLKVIQALRETATQIATSGRYEWGHMGSCNCGHLAQNITSFTRAEIQQFALQKRGDWSEQVIDYCPTSGYPMDLIIGRMIEFGFTQSDLRQLENLSNPEILAKAGVASFNRNVMSDTVKYMNAWADLLENQWMEQNINHIVLPTFEREEMMY